MWVFTVELEELVVVEGLGELLDFGLGLDKGVTLGGSHGD